jgi:hypothetical protein
MAPGRELARLLAELQPAELVLRDWVAPQLDASMLDELAAADYGSDVEEHRRAIDSLLTADRLPDRLAWHPSEVLELMRWSMPDDPAWEPGSTGRRGHLLRLFSCLVLVAIYTGYGAADSLAPLVDSAVELGPAAVAPTVRYLAWCRLHEPGDWGDDPAIRPLLTFALLLLLASTPPPDGRDMVEELACALVDELEAVEADRDPSGSAHAVPSLLGLEPQANRYGLWLALTDRCLIEGPVTGTELGSRLALLGEAVRRDIDASTADLRTLFPTEDDAGESATA